MGEITGEVRRLLEASYPRAWVEGELADLSQPRSGHIYFSLKDGSNATGNAPATLSCAWFKNRQGRGKPAIDSGQHVIVRGRLTVYEPTGRFQMIVDQLEDAGEGALLRAFEQLKARLNTEGLFDRERKRALPALPRRVAIVTSPSGAVLHDVATTFARRFPSIALRLYPVAVQGTSAVDEIVHALAVANQRKDCDAIIVCRGGGSLQDLWAFNEERVARAIFDSALPVVSAVGHETDVSIADFVADARAPTPTAAAELLSPDGNEYRDAFVRHTQRLTRVAQQTLDQFAQRVDMTTRRLVHPLKHVEHARTLLNARRRELTLHTKAHINAQRLSIDRLNQRLTERSPHQRVALYLGETHHLRQRLALQLERTMEKQRQRIKHLEQRLTTASPMATLARGYAIVEDAETGRVLSHSAQASPGQKTRTRLGNGELMSTIDTVSSDE